MCGASPEGGSYDAISVVSIALLAVMCGTATAQSATDRLEISAQASLLRLSDFNATNAGVGGRVSFDLTTWAALDGEVMLFPHDTIAGAESTTSIGGFRVAQHRRRTDALLGLRLGTRTERLGAFFRIRPGLTRLSDTGIDCVGPGCAVVTLARTSYRTEFAFDLGGGMEFYPSPRTVARADLGDTIIRHRSAAPPCPATSCTSHNLSSRFGIGVRF
jgi:opacity protein-like surface antigen